MNELVEMLRDVPPSLAAAWGGWLAVGLSLLLWHLRAREGEEEHARLAVIARTRAKSGVRPPSGIRRAAKPAPADAFSELEAMLEPDPTTGNLSRRPGD
jgi:hypothetical protein